MPVSINKLRMLAGVVVVAVAGGSGYYMQTSHSGYSAPSSVRPSATVGAASPALVADQGPLAPVLPPRAETPPVTRAAARPVLLVPEATPALPVPEGRETGSLTPVAAEPVGEMPMPGSAPYTGRIADECEVGFTATAAPGAMVELTLEAPCRANQKADIFHAGTRFTVRLDERGLARALVPALEEEAFFSALFADGRAESTDILMLTAGDYRRFALFWKGETGFDLYALENGAEYGAPGMVSAGQPYDARRALAGEGGFFTALGSGGTGAYRALVYSWPVRLGDFGPAPEISIEAEVLESTCGTEITAGFLATGPNTSGEVIPLFMEVPGCDAVGQYLVLKNPPLPVTIAAN